jgi:hypothetical protein
MAKGQAMTFIARWSFEVPFGKKEEAFRVLDRWDEYSSKIGWPPHRALVGSIGVSEAVVESEYPFETLAELDEAWSKLGDPTFHKWQEEIAPFVVPGSHKWMIYRVHEPATRRAARAPAIRGKRAAAPAPVGRATRGMRRTPAGAAPTRRVSPKPIVSSERRARAR